MGFGQPVQLFHAAAQADAKNLAPPDGDQRVRQLVALAQRVLFAEGVKVGKHALTPPGRAGDHDGKSAHQHARNQEEHAGVDAAQEQDAHGDHGHHHEGAHVGLGQQQHAHDGHGRAHGQHGAEEALLHFHLAHHVVGGVDEHGKLGHLGGLKTHGPDGQPAARAIDHLAHAGDQHRHQEQQRDHKQPGRHPLPQQHGHLERQQRRHKPHHQIHHVAGEEMGGRVVGKPGVVRHRNRRRIHHHQPPGEQRHHHPQQGLVKAQHTRGRAGRLAVFGTTHTHGQHIGRLAGQATEPAGQALQQGAGGCSHAMPSADWPASSAMARTVSQKTCARCS